MNNKLQILNKTFENKKIRTIEDINEELMKEINEL